MFLVKFDKVISIPYCLLLLYSSSFTERNLDLKFSAFEQEMNIGRYDFKPKMICEGNCEINKSLSKCRSIFFLNILVWKCLNQQMQVAFIHV